mmetsp:Transcript_12154/g.30594  ORF Transcript_12154/g.30594 Transcript_12154/m.30594 type:complete len:255 (-) Transcript_12154:1200-1964(-)
MQLLLERRSGCIRHAQCLGLLHWRATPCSALLPRAPACKVQAIARQFCMRCSVPHSKGPRGFKGWQRLARQDTYHCISTCKCILTLLPSRQDCLAHLSAESRLHLMSSPRLLLTSRSPVAPPAPWRCAHSSKRSRSWARRACAKSRRIPESYTVRRCRAAPGGTCSRCPCFCMPTPRPRRCSKRTHCMTSDHRPSPQTLPCHLRCRCGASGGPRRQPGCRGTCLRELYGRCTCPLPRPCTNECRRLPMSAAPAG